jgi:hypothetical protein
MTAKEFISLPVPESVKIIKIGIDLFEDDFPENKSQISPSNKEPAAIAFAESITLPPPTARIPSILFCLIISIPS